MSRNLDGEIYKWLMVAKGGPGSGRKPENHFEKLGGIRTFISDETGETRSHSPEARGFLAAAEHLATLKPSEIAGSTAADKAMKICDDVVFSVGNLDKWNNLPLDERHAIEAKAIPSWLTKQIGPRAVRDLEDVNLHGLVKHFTAVSPKMAKEREINLAYSKQRVSDPNFEWLRDHHQGVINHDGAIRSALGLDSEIAKGGPGSGRRPENTHEEIYPYHIANSLDYDDPDEDVADKWENVAFLHRELAGAYRADGDTASADAHNEAAALCQRAAEIADNDQIPWDVADDAEIAASKASRRAENISGRGGLPAFGDEDEDE